MNDKLCNESNLPVTILENQFQKYTPSVITTNRNLNVSTIIGSDDTTTNCTHTFSSDNGHISLYQYHHPVLKLWKDEEERVIG